MNGDLTNGPIPGRVLAMAAPIAIGMVFQTLYYLVDLYFVGRLGEHAIAGVGAAGNLSFVVLALTQVLAVGSMALIAQASGRRDREDARLVFNQTLTLAGMFVAGLLLLGYGLAGVYMRALAADPGTTAAGLEYLHWYLPGLALQFPLVAMSAALRGTGIVKPAMLVQVLTVLINAVLAPVLIAGWGTGRPLGVAGAGLATTIAILIGVIILWRIFERMEHTVAVDRAMLAPRMSEWRLILRIGTPAGAEFALMFVYLVVIYAAIRPFGAEAQAGFGIGQRVMQAMLLPVMALAFATAPVAGQNYGARSFDRVRQTFSFAATAGCALMFMLTLICQWRPDALIDGFTDDAGVVRIGAGFLSIISWNFVPSALIFTCSGMFQALGHTLPSLIASASRLVTFVVPLVLLSHMPQFAIRTVWFLSLATTMLQTLISLWLLRRELGTRLSPAVAATGTV